MLCDGNLGVGAHDTKQVHNMEPERTRVNQPIINKKLYGMGIGKKKLCGIFFLLFVFFYKLELVNYIHFSIILCIL